MSSNLDAISMPSVGPSPGASPLDATGIEDVNTGDSLARDVPERETAPSYHEDNREHSLSSDTPDYGAEGLLTLPALSGEPEDIDIDLQFDTVIVHGFSDGYRPPLLDSESNYATWLSQQGVWSAKHVMSFQYNISKVLSGRQARGAIRNAALDLLHGLMAKRIQRDKVSPIMFIAHDIGGIIVKDALIAAALNLKKFGDIFDFTRVLLFFECPHRAKDQSDMEERLSRFLYKIDARSKLPSLARSTLPLAEAVLEVNGLFLNSKHFFQSYIISVFSSNSRHDTDKVFDDLAGTMGVPFEFRIENQPQQNADENRIKDTLSCFASELRVDSDGASNVRMLISAASPLLPLRTAPGPKHTFSWISEKSVYKSWYRQQKPQLLYIYGIEDTMSASEYIFYDLDKLRHRNNHQIVLYFKFDRFDIRCDTIQDMLATFLAQIIGHFPTIKDSADNQFKQHKLQRSWNYSDLIHWFEYYRQIGEIDGISCIVDHFDECEPTSRKDFLNIFRDESETQERPWRILVTSHKSGALLNELSDDGWLKMDLGHIESPMNDASKAVFATGDEIKKSLLENIPEHRFYERLIDQETQIISKLEPGLRRLIFDHMSSNKNWPIHETIHSRFGLSENLSMQVVLDRILTDLPNPEQVKMILWWILYSVRPPTTWEMEEAINLFIQLTTDDHFTSYRSAPFKVVLESLAGIISCEQDELRIAQHEIRDLLTLEYGSGTHFGFVSDGSKDTPHALIARICLRYLHSDAARGKLTALYNESAHRGTHMALVCDRTSLCDYATEFWPHHIAQAAKDHACEIERDLESFVRSDNVEVWLAAFWTLANPITRSPQPYTTIYPILVGAGLLDQADGLMDIEQDIAAAMIEACLCGHSDISLELLSRASHTTDSLESALVAVGSSGDEVMWLRIIEYIRTSYSEFPWQNQGSQLARASWLGLCGVLKALIIARCPLEGSDPVIPLSRTPLSYAIRTNNVDAVNLLLNNGANPRHREKGGTALHIAACRGSPKIIETLIAAGGDINSRADDLTTPVYQACLWGNFQAAKQLLSLRADPNINDREDKDTPGWSPLIVAMQESHRECARLLIESNADPNTVGINGSALSYAITSQLFEVFELLIEKGASLNHPKDGYSALQTVLSQTNLDRRLDFVRVIIESDADVNEAAPKSAHPLILASWLKSHESHDVVDLLLSHGADVNCKDDNGLRPIQIAAHRGDRGLVCRLLEEKNIELKSYDKDFWPPLTVARDNVEIMRVLLEAGADPNSVTEIHESPITAAVKANNIEVVRLLIEHGAVIDPLRIDDNRWEPLEYAVVFGKVDMIRALCDSGADANRRWSDHRTLVHKAMRRDGLGALLEFRPEINIQDDDGDTPLHLLDSNIPVENVKLLVRAGADINAVNKRNFTPLTSALKVRHEPAARVLFSMKPNLNIASPILGGPLHLACNMGMLEFAQDLIIAGADVNLAVPGIAGTPLISVFAGYPDSTCQDDKVKTRIIDLLLTSGADISATVEMTGNVISAAALRGSTDMLRLLLSRDGQVGVPDIMGRLPIHLAALRGDVDCVNILLEAGENVAMGDNVGRTALHWAAQSGSLEVFQHILTKVGGDSINQPDKNGWTPLCWAARGCGAANGIREVDAETEYKFLKMLLQVKARTNDISKLPNRFWTPLDIAKYHGRSNDVLTIMNNDAQELEKTQEDVPSTPIKQQLTSWSAWCDYCLYNIFGIKYRCIVCDDFDLCYKCYNMRNILHDQEHEFKEEGPEFATEETSKFSDLSLTSFSEVSSDSESLIHE